MSNEAIARNAAEAFRDEFNLGIEPIANIAGLIEQRVGVGVAYVQTATPGHGMTMRHGDRYLIAAGCTEHPMRLRSTLAHELGHLRLGSIDRNLNHDSWQERTTEEKQADIFARHLLVPLGAVKEAAQGVAPTAALLSRLVQKYMASPVIVALQLLKAGAITEELFAQWRLIPSGRLASQYGWHTEYDALVLQSKTPRAPQALLTRAIEGYRWGLVTPATIARLDGKPDVNRVLEQLEANGIRPESTDASMPERPLGSGDTLTPEELALLLNDTE